MEASREEDGHHAEDCSRNVTVGKELVAGLGFHRAEAVQSCGAAGQWPQGEEGRRGPFP